MAMPQAGRVWTRDEVLALPDDGNRYELIAGQLLVSPSPRAVHQLALWELFKQVTAYVDRHRLGLAGLWRGFGVPLLAVEVLSPRTARHDRVTKRRRYQQAGVATYWIVDPDGCLVEVWHPGSEHPVIEDRTLEWRPDPALPPLVIDLDGYFRPEWRGSAG
jgi:Uma2 family endonuclease